MNAWVAILAALGPASLLGTLLNTYLQRRKLRAEEGKTDADAAQVLSRTAADLVEPLRRELQATRKELSDTRDEISAMRTHLTAVEGMLRQNGIPVPPFRWPTYPTANGDRH